jgi:SAM-dependent methyltransferase
MTPDELRALAFSFRAARALYAGIELGLFEALDAGATTADELAEECACDARALRVWLRALEGLGVLEADADGHRIPKDLREALVPDRGARGAGEAYLGNLFLHDLWHWSRWGALDLALRRGTLAGGVEGDRHLGNPEVLRNFLPNYNAAMEQSADGAPARLARAIAENGPGCIVDLGGGTGALLAASCALLPGARGVLVEHGFALEGARARLARDPARARIELLELDFEKAPIPRGDAIVLSRVLMGLAPERARALVARAAAALEPGGRLFVHDFALDTRVGALLGLDMLLNTGGEVHAGSAIREWLAAAGLSEIEERPVLPYTRMWVGTAA